MEETPIQPRTFQSTLPARGATSVRAFFEWLHRISIHAPRTGSDINGFDAETTGFYFNPRSPHGERPKRLDDSCIQRRAFQSTLPARGATGKVHARYIARRNFNPRSPHGERPAGAGRNDKDCRISIHAPRTGSDDEVALMLEQIHHFNPRSPHGERP